MLDFKSNFIYFNISPVKFLALFSNLIKNPVLVKFFVRLTLFYLVWKTSYFFIYRVDALGDAYRAFSIWFIGGILYGTSIILELLQYDPIIDYAARTIRNAGEYYAVAEHSQWETLGVEVGEPCIGYGVMYLFFALIVSYPGNNKAKWWFVPMGLSFIYFINLCRIAILTIMVKYKPEVWEMNHKFIFKIVVYSLIFMLWMWWFKLHEKKLAEASEEKPENAGPEQ